MGADPARRYIVSPAYDWLFFILPPTLATAFAIVFAGRFSTMETVTAEGAKTTLAGLLLGTIVHAHLVAVFARSHNNSDIFKLFKIRFTLVPIALWVAIVIWDWFAVAAVVTATFWDVYHSGAQTFGFARIYDRNAGMPPEAGRRLDFWLNQLMYAGPILAGVTLAPHLADMDRFAAVDSPFLASVPARVLGNQRYVTWGILILSAVFLVVYVIGYARLCRRGYRFPFVKVFLLVTTAACSITAWGFNTWGEAFFIMNLFHAWQYLALVWAMERKKIMERLRVASVRGGALIAAVAFFSAVFGYGYAAEIMPGLKSTTPLLHALWAATIVVSLMHFWYDGFVWSVRKGQV